MSSLWQPFQFPLASVQHLPPVNLTIFLAVGINRQVYYTEDALSATPTWISIGNPSLDDFEPGYIAINPSNDKLWVTTAHYSDPHGIWILTNLVSGIFTHLSFTNYLSATLFTAHRTIPNKLMFWDDEWNGYTHIPPFYVCHTEDGINWVEGAAFPSPDYTYSSGPTDLYYVDNDSHAYLSLVVILTLSPITYEYRYFSSADNGDTWTLSGIKSMPFNPASIRYRMPGTFHLYHIRITGTGPYTSTISYSADEMETETVYSTLVGTRLLGTLIVSPDEQKMVVYYYNYSDSTTHLQRSLDNGLTWTTHNTSIRFSSLKFISNTELFQPGHYSIDFGDTWVAMSGTPGEGMWITNNV